MPWLPPLPRDLDTSTVWGAYLHARAEQITDLAAAATAQADKLRSSGDTRLAEGVSRMDPTLVNDLALWNATHPNHQPDEQLPEPERQHPNDLDKRTQAVRAVWLTRGRDPRLLPPATREALAYADQHHRRQPTRQPTRQPENRYTPPVPRPTPPAPHRPPPGRGVSR